MKTFLLHASLFLLCMTCAIAQDLDGLHKSFMSKYDQINSNRDAKVEALTEGYLGALDRLKKQLQTTGQLDLVLQAQNEIDAIGQDVWPLEKLGEKATSELKTLRTKYVESREKTQKDHATQLSEVVDKMEKLLATQTIELTKAGKIEEAKLAQKMKDDLAGDAAIAEARLLIKGNASGDDEGWINLWEMKEKWVTKQIIHGVEFDKNPPPDLNLDKVTIKKSKIAHASSSFEYDINKRVSKLKCGMWLPYPGDVIYIIKADGVEVLRKQIVGPTKEIESVEITFKPATKIDFITDMNGVTDNDWAVWVKPQVKN